MKRKPYFEAVHNSQIKIYSFVRFKVKAPQPNGGRIIERPKMGCLRIKSGRSAFKPRVRHQNN